MGPRGSGGGTVVVQAADGPALRGLNGCGPGPSAHLKSRGLRCAMPSGGNQSPPPPPPAAASSEEEEEDGDAADGAQPAGSPGPQIQQRFEELCSRLNMDEAARAEAWGSYRSMSESYTLEVRAQTIRRGRGARCGSGVAWSFALHHCLCRGFAAIRGDALSFALSYV